LFTTNRLYKS